MSPEPTAHPSTLRLHQLRLGELDAGLARELRSHLDTCDRCAGRHQHQLAVEREFQTMPPPLAVPRPGFWARLGGWLTPSSSLRVGLPLLAAALAAVTLIPRPGQPEETVGSEPAGAASTERPKGLIPGLQVWVQTNGSPRPLYTNEALGPSARVQLRFNPRGRRFVTLAGRDGAGRVEVYGTVPATGDSVQSAPFALTLDDTPGAQNFYAIYTDIRPGPDEVSRSLERDPVALPGAEVEKVVIPKKE